MIHFNEAKKIFRQTVFLILALALPDASFADDKSVTWEVANRFGPFEAFRDIDGNASPIDVFDAWKFLPEESYADWHERIWSGRSELFGSLFFTSPYSDLIQASNGEDRITALWDPVRDVHQKRIASLARGEGTVQIIARSTFDHQSCTWQLAGEVRKTDSCAEYIFDFPLNAPATNLTVTSIDGSQSAVETIEIEHILIVGLGESYASGQGNPDVPARWKSWAEIAPPKVLDVSWLNKPDRYLDGSSGEARWIDAECYRSFFNYQTLVAFKIASERPKSFVSFLHYACSGAEVFDGLLNPQRIPVGSNRDNRFGQHNGETWFQARSQLNSLVMDLCSEPGDLVPFPDSIQQRLTQSTGSRVRHAFQRHNSFVGALEPDPTVSPSTQGDGRSYSEQQKLPGWAAFFKDTLPSDGLPSCPSGIVKPDFVLLGIGGNDAGFESIARFYIAPSDFKTGLFASFASGEICPRSANLGSNSAARRACKLKAFSRYDTEDLIEGNWSRKCANRLCQPLKKRLSLSFDAIMAVTGVTAEKIVTPVYPDPFRSVTLPVVSLSVALPNYAGNRATGRVPVLSQGANGGTDKIHNPFSRWLGATVLIPGGAEFAKLRRFDVTRQEAEVMLREVESIRSQQRDAASHSGVSLVYATRDAFLDSPWTFGEKGHLPNASRKAEWDPSTWEPYAYEQSARAIRTFNDSLLTQQDFDEHIDFRGTAHPNLTGHRLLAERVLSCSIAILDEKPSNACHQSP